jgi:hypothetical protein
VLLVDLRKVEHRTELNQLVHDYRTIMFDRTYLAIDATEPGGGFTAYDRRELEPGLFWKWFVNQRRPPVEWVPDERFDDPDRLFPRNLNLKPSFSVGGSGGGAFAWHCPTKMNLRGLNLGVQNPAAPRIGWFEPICVPVGDSDREGEYVGPAFGYQPPNPNPRFSHCAGDRRINGLHGRSGLYLDAVGVLCSSKETEDGAKEVFGGGGGDAFSRRCPGDTVAWGVRGRAGHWIDAIGLICREPADRPLED